MASGRIRSTRRLRSWIVEQVNSEKYLGLVWDNPEKTMFRIPWKHAGKQDFRTDEDAAIFKVQMCQYLPLCVLVSYFFYTVNNYPSVSGT